MAWIHRTVGLFLGTWLMIVGLSGAVLVFYKEIDTWLHADQMTIAAAPSQPDFNKMLAQVRTAHPDRIVLFFQRYGLSDQESYPFVLSEPQADPATIGDLEAAGALEVFVDPVTFTILGQRPYHTPLRILRSLHKELLVPGAGERTLGAVGVVLLATVIAGIVLWWRENRGRLRRALRLRFSSPTPRLVRDAHTVPALYASAFIAFQIITGIIVCDWFAVRTFFARLTGPATVSRSTPTPMEPISPPIGPNRAAATALAEHPASDVVLINFPRTNAGTYAVRLYPRDEDVARHTRQYMIDAQSGAVTMRFDADLLPLHLKILNLWMIWIHKGYLFGLPGRIVVLITGLVLATLFPTGLYIWFRKRRVRRPPSRATANAGT